MQRNSNNTFLLIGVVLACTGAIIGVQFYLDNVRRQGSLNPESYRAFAVDLAAQSLHEASIEYYDMYMEKAELTPESRARVQYQVGKILQDDLFRPEDALARYVLAKRLDPKSEVANDLNERMVEALEALDRSTDAAAVLRDATALKSGQKEPTPVVGIVVAQVGDEAITMQDFDAAWQSLPPQLQQGLSTPSKKLEFLRSYVGRQVMARAARRKGLDKSPEIRKQLEQMEKDILVQQLIQNEIMDRTNFSEDELRLYYDANPGRYISPRQVEIAHLQLDSEDRAQELLSELRGGADWAATVQANSTNAQTRDNAGYIGFIQQEGPLPILGNAPNIQEAAFDLKVGAYSFVINEGNAFHILRVMSERNREQVPFESVRTQVQQDLAQERAQSIQQDMFERYLQAEDVQIFNDRFFSRLGVDPSAVPSSPVPSTP